MFTSEFKKQFIKRYKVLKMNIYSALLKLKEFNKASELN